jgi:hypothetical protein
LVGTRTKRKLSIEQMKECSSILAFHSPRSEHWSVGSMPEKIA